MTEKTLKTAYYTAENIDEQASIFLKKLDFFRQKHSDQIISPNDVALLVVDMQGFFYNSNYHAFVPSMAAIIPKIKALQDLCFAHNMPVIHTRHSNTEADSRQMLSWWGRMTEADSDLVQIIPELRHPRAKIIEKTQYDAFLDTELEGYLREKNIKQVIICGVMTHLCCETTARAAFTRGFGVFFAIDGTATYDPVFQMSTLRNLAHGFALPVLIKEIINRLDSSF
ncbi:MAG: isochorismatase family protein [Gammaproteobacteria bacterium]|nr:isochorismatase family protein [Gammaproteobacteria bacterium]